MATHYVFDEDLITHGISFESSVPVPPRVFTVGGAPPRTQPTALSASGAFGGYRPGATMPNESATSSLLKSMQRDMLVDIINEYVAECEAQPFSVTFELILDRVSWEDPYPKCPDFERLKRCEVLFIAAMVQRIRPIGDTICSKNYDPVKVYFMDPRRVSRSMPTELIIGWIPELCRLFSAAEHIFSSNIADAYGILKKYIDTYRKTLQGKLLCNPRNDDDDRPKKDTTMMVHDDDAAAADDTFSSTMHDDDSTMDEDDDKRDDGSSSSTTTVDDDDDSSNSKSSSKQDKAADQKHQHKLIHWPLPKTMPYVCQELTDANIAYWQFRSHGLFDIGRGKLAWCSAKMYCKVYRMRDEPDSIPRLKKLYTTGQYAKCFERGMHNCVVTHALWRAIERDQSITVMKRRKKPVLTETLSTHACIVDFESFHEHKKPGPNAHHTDVALYESKVNLTHKGYKACLGTKKYFPVTELSEVQKAYFERYTKVNPEEIAYYKSVEQKSDEWFEGRNDKNEVPRVTGSRTAGAVDHDEFVKSRESHARDLSRNIRTEATPNMRYGTEHEDEARDQYIAEQAPIIQKKVLRARKRGRDHILVGPVVLPIPDHALESNFTFKRHQFDLRKCVTDARQERKQRIKTAKETKKLIKQLGIKNKRKPTKADKKMLEDAKMPRGPITFEWGDFKAIRIPKNVDDVADEHLPELFQAYNNLKYPLSFDSMRYHYAFAVLEQGIHICERENWLGTSADGLILVFGHVIGVLEIKCPAGARQPCPVKPARYNEQFQANMFVEQLPFIHVYQWSAKKGTTTDIVYYDRAYCENYLIPGLRDFYFRLYLPQVIRLGNLLGPLSKGLLDNDGGGGMIGPASAMDQREIDTDDDEDFEDLFQCTLPPEPTKEVHEESPRNERKIFVPSVPNVTPPKYSKNTEAKFSDPPGGASWSSFEFKPREHQNATVATNDNGEDDESESSSSEESSSDESEVFVPSFVSSGSSSFVASNSETKGPRQKAIVRHRHHPLDLLDKNKKKMRRDSNKIFGTVDGRITRSSMRRTRRQTRSGTRQ